MTIGDQIWADAVCRTGIWMAVRQSDAARWRQFALTVIHAINESHGIKEVVEKAEDE